MLSSLHLALKSLPEHCTSVQPSDKQRSFSHTFIELKILTFQIKLVDFSHSSRLFLNPPSLFYSKELINHIVSHLLLFIEILFVEPTRYKEIHQAKVPPTRRLLLLRVPI